MCYLCLNGTIAAGPNHNPILKGSKIYMPLRVLEETYDDDWRPFGRVDMTTGLVEFDFDDYTRAPSIFNAKLPKGNPYGAGLDLAEYDDDKIAITLDKCHWPTYQDYLGLSESYKFCTKCGKKEKDHD